MKFALKVDDRCNIFAENYFCVLGLIGVERSGLSVGSQVEIWCQYIVPVYHQNSTGPRESGRNKLIKQLFKHQGLGGSFIQFCRISIR